VLGIFWTVGLLNEHIEYCEVMATKFTSKKVELLKSVVFSEAILT